MMFLDDSTLQAVRDELNRHRKPGAYEPGKWSVSHHNRDSKALGVAAPERVFIRDITLRTMLHVNGVGLSDDETLEVAKALANAKVPVVEVPIAPFEGGKPFGLERTKKLIAAMKERNPSVEIASGAWSAGAIQLFAQLGVDWVSIAQVCMPGITPGFLFGPVWEGKDWRSIRIPDTIEKQIDRYVRLVEKAKQVGIKIAPGINWVGHVTEDYIRAVVPKVVDAGADQIGLADSGHGMGPEAWRYVCSFVKSVAPSCVIGVHTHDDFGLATASDIAAALGGATYVDASVNGLGTGTGQADLAEVAASMEVLYGIHTGIQLEQLTALSRLVADVTRQPVPTQKPITGENAWNFNGIDEMLWCNEIDPLFPKPANPEIFGNRYKNRGLIGSDSGNWAMYWKLQDMGIEVDKGKIPEILAAVKREICLRHRSLSDEEILALARGPQGR